MSQTKAQLIDPVDGTIVNADINASAAIAGSKISPSFTANTTITAASPVLRLADSTDPQSDGGSIGKIEFFGNDGSSGGVDVRSFIQTISTNSSGNAHALLIGLGESNNAPTEKVRILGDGKVGIGITSPTSKLYVNGVSTDHVITAAIADDNGNSIINILAAGTTGNSRILFSDTAANDGIISYSHNDRALVFGTAGTSEDMRLDSSGRLLIGTTTEGHENADDFTVAGSANTGITIRSGTSNFGQIFFSDGTSGDTEYRGIIGYSHSDNHMKFHTDADERMRINSAGQLLSGTTTSNSSDTNALFAGGGNAGTNNYGKIFLSAAETNPGPNTALSFVGTGTNNVSNTAMAFIGVHSDGQHASNDYPTRFGFFTTNAGSSGATEKVRFHSGGTVNIPAGVTLGEAITSTASSNTLSDFETGTFTPILSDSLSSGTANSYQNQSGHYTKIGNIVHIIGAIRADDISNLSSSANLKLRNLPFVVSDVTTGGGEPDMALIPFINNLTSDSNRGFVYGRMENQASAFQMGYAFSTGQSGGNLTFSQINSGSATFFSFSATYRTGS